MARLKKTVIKKGPSPEKIKLEEAAGFTELATSYVDALKSKDIQPEFIVKHADTFRGLFFDYLEGKLAYRSETDGKTKRLEEQTEELREENELLWEECKQLRERICKIEARAKAKEKKEKGGPESCGTGPDWGPGQSERKDDKEEGTNWGAAEDILGRI